MPREFPEFSELRARLAARPIVSSGSRPNSGGLFATGAEAAPARANTPSVSSYGGRPEFSELRARLQGAAMVARQPPQPSTLQRLGQGAAELGQGALNLFGAAKRGVDILSNKLAGLPVQGEPIPTGDLVTEALLPSERHPTPLLKNSPLGALPGMLPFTLLEHARGLAQEAPEAEEVVRFAEAPIREVSRTATNLGTDPLLLGLGPLAKVPGLSRAVGLGFGASAGLGAVRSGQEALEEGVTPEGVGAATRAGLEGALGGLGLAHGLAGLRGLSRTKRPTAATEPLTTEPPVPVAPAAERRLSVRRGPEVELPLGEQRVVPDRRQQIKQEFPEAPEPLVERLARAEQDPITGLPNRTVYESDRSSHQGGYGSVDLAGLKWVNDNLGHPVGDALLKAFGQAASEQSGARVYRVGGDEFAILADSPEAAQAAGKAIQDRFKQAKFVAERPDGTQVEYTGGRADFGTGPTFESADAALLAEREAAQLRGERAARGQRPVGLVEATASGDQAQSGIAQPAPGPGAPEAASPIPARQTEAKVLGGAPPIPKPEQPPAKLESQLPAEGLGEGAVPPEQGQLRAPRPSMEGLPPESVGAAGATAPTSPPRIIRPIPDRPRAGAGEPPSGGGPAEPPFSKDLTDRALKLGERLSSLASSFEAGPEKLRIALEQAGRVKERGTIAPEVREQFRGEGQPREAKTREFRFSARDIELATSAMTDALGELSKAERDFSLKADPQSAWTMRTAKKLAQDAVKAWQVYRSAAGRAVKQFDRPPEAVFQKLREAGLLVGNLKTVREKVPITTNIIQSLRKMTKEGLSDAEKDQLKRDILDQYRLNLFTVTSWTLDAVGNAAEAAVQGAEGVSRDLVRVSRGDVSFPSLQGMWRAIRATGKQLPRELEESLGQTAASERFAQAPGAGTFTYRRGFGPEGSLTKKLSKASSTIYDYLIGGPLYAKGAFDTAAKRFAAFSTIYEDAIVASKRAGLGAPDQQVFMDNFLLNLPKSTTDRALSNARKAGFDRDLSRWEEKYASSSAVKLLADAFGRWPFQFTRWAGEMLGWNPELMRKTIKGRASAEEVASYLTRTATGIGGLYLLNNMYNAIDWKTMEYVKEDGNRVRLSGREPLATGLWLLATLKGDADASTTALRHTSLPFARIPGLEGGLLSRLLTGFNQAIKNPQNDPRALRRELEEALNKAIPGQAILGALESVINPEVQEGLGARLPGISETLPSRVDPTTGKPLKLRERPLGALGVEAEVPAVSGAPIPGSVRVLTPVQKLLERYNLVTYRGLRQPIAGWHPTEVPDEVRREWEEAFGRHREQLLAPMVRAIRVLESQPDEKVRQQIQKKDAEAARLATREVTRRHGGKVKLERRPSREERSGPRMFQEQR